VEEDVNKKKEIAKKKDEPLPPSKRIELDNKGVGPIKQISLSDKIDPDMVAVGKEFFGTKCISCHMADSKLVGPAPKGILDCRSPEWIMNMMINPQEMLKKDPLAKEMLTEFKGVPMIDQNLNEEEARAILEYFRTL